MCACICQELHLYKWLFHISTAIEQKYEKNPQHTGIRHSCSWFSGIIQCHPKGTLVATEFILEERILNIANLECNRTFVLPSWNKFHNMGQIQDLLKSKGILYPPDSLSPPPTLAVPMLHIRVIKCWLASVALNS